MKYPFLRRAGALVLALALIMSMSLIAPARAATGDATEGEVTGGEATGGNATGGDATGGDATGGDATGGDATGGDATGGGATGGDATGGGATGGNALTLTIVGERVWTNETTSAGKNLSVLLTGAGAAANPTIRWSAEPQSGQAGAVAPTFAGFNGASVEYGYDYEYDEDGEVVSKWPVSATVTGDRITVVEETAGEFVITAEYIQDGKVLAKATMPLTISGVILSGTRLNAREKRLEMYVNGSAILTYSLCGAAVGQDVTWFSSESSVVYVMPTSGNLNAWGTGTSSVSATTSDGKYSASCTVEVKEDESVIASGYKISTNSWLKLSEVYPRLEEICKEKMFEKTGLENQPLRYITNLKVSTDQGTLYYNYNTEADTGDGVGSNDQYGASATGSIRRVDRLYFVPTPGFMGTADISFTGVSGGQTFSGIIRVEVGAGGSSGDGSVEEFQITYGARAGEPVWFQTSDFRTFVDRDFSYVVFNLPKASDGVLYYNYVAGSGNPVSTSTQFSQSGRYTIDDVCFVPNLAYNGDPIFISFRVVDTAGDILEGKVKINVIPISGEGDPSSVTLSGERNQPVTLQGEMFNAACKATISDTLSFVTFKLPDPDVGTLYINYRSNGTFDSRVTAGTRCYYSGSPGINSVSFVPAPSTAGRVAIPYTGYGVGGASFGGTLYITLDEADRSVIRYSVAKNGVVSFRASDFNAASQYQTGSGVNRVVFTDISGSHYTGFDFGSLGSLCYNYRSNYPNALVYPDDPYYYSTNNSWQNQLGLISFHAGNTAGTVTLSYEAYKSAGDTKPSFSGTVVIQVGNLSPEDVRFSCTTGGEAWMYSVILDNACSGVMSSSLSYIEITSVPDAEAGRLYFNYGGFGTGTAVKPGDRFYRTGSPSINSVSFIPHARFTGDAEITYIAHSGNGLEQVSGRIVVNVAAAASSLYFTDIGPYTWAIDSVDYLYRNGTVQGVGGTNYEPSGTVRRGDFVLMLVRAYHLSASGTAAFNDVPADSYYADAIRTAALLGIISGSNGYFYPRNALTRQDAMVMIYNTLKASGKTTSNGLAADLSGFHDAKQIDSYAIEAMGALVQMGVVKGDGAGYLWPKSQLNRAEAAMLLHTIMTL